MKRLTKEEFQERAQAGIRARRIFIPHFTKSITVAFELYQEVLAEQERKLVLEEERKHHYGILSEKIRPLCPECGNELFLRIISAPIGPQNKKGYNSAWVCSTGDCIHEEFSTNTLQDWLKLLPNKEERENG